MKVLSTSTPAREVAPGSGDIGMVGVTGPIPLGYYKDEEKTAATFRIVDGVRYSIPGDYATVEADGTIQLLGRGSACINTGGEKVYPEEVELLLREHPGVFDCLVVGVPDDRFGETVVALVVPAAPTVPTPRRSTRGAAAGSPATSARSASCSSTTSHAPPPARPTTASSAPSPRSSRSSPVLASATGSHRPVFDAKTAWKDGEMADSGVPAVDVAEGQRRAAAGALLLDVREPDEWHAGHAEGAQWIPMGQVATRSGEIPADRDIVVICRVGGRSAKVTADLVAAGLDAVNLAGGMQAWDAAGFAVVTDDGTPGTVV